LNKSFHSLFFSRSLLHRSIFVSLLEFLIFISYNLYIEVLTLFYWKAINKSFLVKYTFYISIEWLVFFNSVLPIYLIKC
jgi:hypothetical protein